MWLLLVLLFFWLIGGCFNAVNTRSPENSKNWFQCKVNFVFSLHLLNNINLFSWSNNAQVYARYYFKSTSMNLILCVDFEILYSFCLNYEGRFWLIIRQRLNAYTFIWVRAYVLDEICNFNLSWIQNNVTKTDA